MTDGQPGAGAELPEPAAEADLRDEDTPEGDAPGEDVPGEGVPGEDVADDEVEVAAEEVAVELDDGGAELEPDGPVTPDDRVVGDGTGGPSGALPVPATQLRLPPEPTGDARVDGALERLGDLEDLPTAEHVAVLEDVHRRLQSALADLGPDA